ncbi:cold shock domain-containing protein [Sphingomonas sp. KR3-1]|uniref:cold-shock protein n=1 Tax=Sphingomonas sp. KR3-1 TaxID=3156611 RepID=UPI0032B409D2
MLSGTVYFYHAPSGFGVIRPDRGGDDAFVHVSALTTCGLERLEPAQRVTYALRTDARGQTCAQDLKLC